MEVVRYKTNDGQSTAIVEAGRKWIRVILMDSGGISVKKVPKTEERFMSPLDYSLNKAKVKFRDSGRRFGITRAAKLLLRS